MQTIYGRDGDRTKCRKKETKNDSRQLAQLLISFGLFLTVFIGKGIWPAQVAKTGEQVLTVIRANTDFRGAFASLGQALSEQESVLGELGDFCVAVFAPEGATPDASAVEVTKQEELSDLVLTEEKAPVQPALQVGDVVQDVEAEPDLPEGYSGQWLYLGEQETTTPVLGRVTSEFGFRDHPSTGRHAVHGGVDIAADTGTEVAAFAGGVVESVGEDSDYGKYVYLTHADGVSSFYAHCSSVCVKRGETVQVGQTVAEVGSTGKSTGPHLHFEVRLEGTRLDPLYYIKPEQAK